MARLESNMPPWREALLYRQTWFQMLLVSAPKNVPAFPADGLHPKFRASLGTQTLKKHNISNEGVEKDKSRSVAQRLG